ncbi:hypothetical protein MJO28_006872 [Puccinia striiformis f. sp. tritici]|uniref:Uncharacterized protein n=1 Tax=Puccinia striiformis f. sp. tritici TaxID=168172 RepID=A0ACC0EEI0_9BASI|nr:hypothetical protein MJO28_006872 [Puccinia striiformis f. sp. tritici]
MLGYDQAPPVTEVTQYPGGATNQTGTTSFDQPKVQTAYSLRWVFAVESFKRKNSNKRTNTELCCFGDPFINLSQIYNIEIYLPYFEARHQSYSAGMVNSVEGS